MKKMLVLTLALSVFAVGNLFANDSNLDVAHSPRKVNVSLVLPTPPPPAPPCNCCHDNARPMPPKHHGKPVPGAKKGECRLHHGAAPKPRHEVHAGDPKSGKRPSVGAPRPGGGGPERGSKAENRR